MAKIELNLILKIKTMKQKTKKSFETNWQNIKSRREIKNVMRYTKQSGRAQMTEKEYFWRGLAYILNSSGVTKGILGLSKDRNKSKSFKKLQP